jgi:hypothetical protein
MERSQGTQVLFWCWALACAVLNWVRPAWLVTAVTTLVVSLDLKRLLALTLAALLVAGWVNLHGSDEANDENSNDPAGRFWLSRYGAVAAKWSGVLGTAAAFEHLHLEDAVADGEALPAGAGLADERIFADEVRGAA